MTWGTVAVIVALMMNLGGLVWGAAKLTTSVSKLEDEVVPRLMTTLERLTSLVQQHDSRIAVLEALEKREPNASVRHRFRRENPDVS